MKKKSVLKLRQKQKSWLGGEVKVENRGTLKVKHEGGVMVLVRIAKCCNPVPGDDIVGYITRSLIVAIHRVDWTFVQRLRETACLLDVEWEDPILKQEYELHIDIYGPNRSGLFWMIFCKSIQYN